LHIPESLAASYRRKALAAFKAAMSLCAWNADGAANRLYYCLYLALVAEFERLGIRPETIDAGSARAAAGDIRLKWTHSFVRKNGSLASLTARECPTVNDAYDLRIIADYRESDVTCDEVKQHFRNVQSILEALGINVGVCP